MYINFIQLYNFILHIIIFLQSTLQELIINRHPQDKFDLRHPILLFFIRPFSLERLGIFLLIYQERIKLVKD